MFNGGRSPTPAPPRVTSNPDQQAPAPASRYAGAPPSHTDVTSSGSGYGSVRANAYKASPAYHRVYNAVKVLAGHAGGSDVLSSGGGDYGRAAIQAYRERLLIQSLLRGIGGTSGRMPIASIHLGEGMVGPKIAGGMGAVGRFLSPLVNNPVTDTLGRFTGETLMLPKSTLVGLESLGAAAVPAITHGNLHPLGHLLSSAVTNDPIVKAFSTGSLKPLSQDPLGAVLDVSGLYGIAGKAAGAASRAGALGDRAAAAAQLARESRPLLPGIEPPGEVPAPPLVARSRSYSPNLVSQAVQKSTEGRLLGKSQKFVAARADHELRQAVSLDHAANQGGRAADTKNLVQAMKAIKPKGKEEANVAPLVASFGTAGSGQLRTMLQDVLANLKREPESVGATAETSSKLEDQLRSALDKRDLKEEDIFNAVRGYAPIRQELDRQMSETGLRSSEEMSSAVQKRYLLQQPDVHFLDKGHAIQDPRLQQVVRDAVSTVRQRKSDLEQAIKDAAGNKAAHTAASRAVADVTRRLPVNFVNDSVMNHLIDTRDVIDSSRAGTKAEHAERVKAARAGVRDAERSLKATVREAKTNKLYGTLVEDPAMPPVRGKLLRGMRVRPVTEEDFQRLASREPAPLAFVSMRNPLRKLVPDLRSKLGGNAAPLAEVGRKTYTGEAIKVGDVQPGWSAVVRSGLNSVDELWRQRELQNFADRYMDPTPHPTEHDAVRAAQAYTAEHGIKMDTVQWQGAYRNVPHSALTELEHQFKLDRPGKLGRLLTTPNRIFRKTVLPYSPKLPIMHNVENVSRVTALEGDPIRALLRAPVDYARAQAVLKAAPDNATREQLRSILAPGGLSRSGAGGEAEDLGRMPDEMGTTRVLAHRTATAMGAIGTQIIRFQRMLESHAQLVALGAHSRQMLQEWGHGWADANTSVTKYADDLARGLADPNEAARAARLMHKTLGQYNAFTANTRLAMRAVPFGSWYINAARLVMVTLPKDHPMFSALLQDVNNSQQLQWDAQHKGLPEDLQTAVSVGPNAWLDVGKLTPIGLPNQSPVATAAQLVMPWASSAALALAGKDPFMQDLKGPDAAFGQGSAPAGVNTGGAGTRQSILSAIESLAQSLGGPLNDVARIAYAHGGTLYNTDTPVLHLVSGGLVGHTDVKKGSSKQQKGLLNLPGPLDRVLDPFHPTTFHSGGGGSGSLSGASQGSLGGSGSGSLSGAGSGSLKGSK